MKASLEKSSIEWRNILQETLFELPENINNLAKYATGVPEVLNILKLTGIVRSALEGDRLQHKLKPGQQLVTKNGGLWRWDGYTHNEVAKTPANQILQNKTNLIEINYKIKNTLVSIDKQKKDIAKIEIKIQNFEKSLNEHNNSQISINEQKINLRNDIEQAQIDLSTYIENTSEERTKIAILESSIEKVKQTIKMSLETLDEFKKKERSLVKEDTLINEIKKISLANKDKKDNLKTHSIIGTPNFISLHIHYKNRYTMRDDLISLCYTLIYCLYGKLPWEHMKSTDMIEEKKIRKIFLLGSISKFYINYIQKKYLKYLINEEINPLLGALRIAKKDFPLEVLINDKKIH